MPNLTTLDRDALATLEDRSRATCVVYRDHPLPAGCDPDTSDIGIEQSSGATLVHIRPVAYQGSDDQVRDWIVAGTRSFQTLTDGLNWLRDRLNDPQPGGSPDPAQSAIPAEPAQGAMGRRPIGEVTDLGQVTLTRAARPTPADLEQNLAAQVLGQEAAIHGLATLAANHVAKPFPRRPASALLVGATGTGKTLAAEQLALELAATTNSHWSYERLDLSEFSERHSVARLFGAPPGYIGYNDGHDLATTLRNNPRTVVLLDEIDKAHPQVWRSLMNLMDAGRLGGQGGEIDARKAMLLFTSNKDAAAIQPLVDAPDQQLRHFLRDHGYPPEIVARIGHVLVFKPLSAEITIQLVVLTVQRVVEAFGFDLDYVAPEAVASLADRAPIQSGGRDLEYFVERELAEQLAALSGSTVSVQIGADMAVTPRPTSITA